MIAALLDNIDSGKRTLLLVLEPGNLVRLKEGSPLCKQLSEFLPAGQSIGDVELAIAYSPDVQWVIDQTKTNWNDSGALLRAIGASLSRPEVVYRERGAVEGLQRSRVPDEEPLP